MQERGPKSRAKALIFGIFERQVKASHLNQAVGRHRLQSIELGVVASPHRVLSSLELSAIMLFGMFELLPRRD